MEMLCVHVYKHNRQTQSTTELKQRLTKSMPGRSSIGGVFIRGKKYLCKKLGGKEGGGHLLKGGVFLRSYGIWLKRVHVMSGMLQQVVVARSEEAMHLYSIRVHICLVA